MDSYGKSTRNRGEKCDKVFDSKEKADSYVREQEKREDLPNLSGFDRTVEEWEIEWSWVNNAAVLSWSLEVNQTEPWSRSALPKSGLLCHVIIYLLTTSGTPSASQTHKRKGTYESYS